MPLFTTVDTPSFPFDINHCQKLTFIGSCFANNIGQQFQQNKFNTLLNPYGVLYNPASVCQCLNAILDGRFNHSQLVRYDGFWHSFLHHSSFSAIDKDECLTNINTQNKIAKQHLENSDVLFITFGTAYIYKHNENIVSNCHKIPSKEFSRYRLSIDEIVTSVTQTLQRIQLINPNIKVVFTISPVRYTKDGMHANSLSKATLHLAVEKICNTNNCYYFPAYEIVTDELRDYRFFAEDLTHPNSTSINLIWERMESVFFTNATQQLCKQVQILISAMQHRPFNPQSPSHFQFLKTMLKKASDLQSKHSELDLSEEIAYFSKKIDA